MSVAFDATVLVDFFNQKLTGDRRAKLDELVATLEKSKTKIVIPTPALTEVLIRAGKAREEIHNALTKVKRASVNCFSKLSPRPTQMTNSITGAASSIKAVGTPRQCLTL